MRHAFTLIKLFVVMVIIVNLAAAILSTASAQDKTVAPGPREREEAAMAAEEQKIMGTLKDNERRYATALLAGKELEIDLAADAPARTGIIGKLVLNNVQVGTEKRPSADGRSYITVGRSASGITEFRVDEVIDKRSALVHGYRLWLEGVDTSEMTSDSKADFGDYVFEGKGTKTYDTQFGGSRTVKRFVVVDMSRATDAVVDIKAVRRFRVWLDKSGKHTIRARFVEFKGGTVSLELKDGKEKKVPMKSLSDDDQEWVRKEVTKESRGRKG
jgi:type II secretory pathway pseudopilin PulG